MITVEHIIAVESRPKLPGRPSCFTLIGSTMQIRATRKSCTAVHLLEAEAVRGVAACGQHREHRHTHGIARPQKRWLSLQFVLRLLSPMQLFLCMIHAFSEEMFLILIACRRTYW